MIFLDALQTEVKEESKFEFLGARPNRFPNSTQVSSMVLNTHANIFLVWTFEVTLERTEATTKGVL